MNWVFVAVLLVLAHFVSFVVIFVLVVLLFFAFFLCRLLFIVVVLSFSSFCFIPLLFVLLSLFVSFVPLRHGAGRIFGTSSKLSSFSRATGARSGS